MKDKIFTILQLTLGAVIVKCYRMAAEQGSANAQLLLGDTYSDGLAVAQDYAEAFKWYKLAAVQGNASAQYNLGLMYYRGRAHGVIQDSTEADNWLKLAAAQGDSRAQGLLHTRSVT